MFKLNHNRITPEYLRFYYLSIAGQAALFTKASGSTAAGIRADRLKSSVVIVPSQKEQIRIVEYLKEELLVIETQIPKIQSAIDKLKEYRTALISAAVTGKIDVRGFASREVTCQ